MKKESSRPIAKRTRQRRKGRPIGHVVPAEYMVADRDGMFVVVEIVYVPTGKSSHVVRDFSVLFASFCEQDADGLASELNGFSGRKRQRGGNV